MILDPVTLSQSLIKFPSITPQDEGIIDFLIAKLEGLGFICNKLEYGNVINLYAKLNCGKQNFCFAGHTDVVPVGSGWKTDPFAAKIIDGNLYGRGAVDMKTAIACFISSVSEFISIKKPNFSISLLISGNEEGDPKYGTPMILKWLKEKGENIDNCLVGEPTSNKKLGDMVKIGRRGSISFKITICGIQGHVAYPDLAKNPIPILINIIKDINNLKLDNGTKEFDKSNIELTSIETDNKATNVIPSEVTANLNIRFNNLHNQSKLESLIREVCKKYSNKFKLEILESSEAFITKNTNLRSLLEKSIFNVIGENPNFSTSGGTSDARFIKDFCNVIEFGLLNKTAHKVDEYVSIVDIAMLTKIYLEVLKNYDRVF